ncbi:Hypothetical predicted protein [Lecanosticta acicola]|uniref:F-box domain-containing protein n=1 Tax=Lecanosticta acicola TaxID=111012 RepID=A0AAI8YT10_9PEZI|nr:Hypothetical predicted protein [Lecanosticta acicola]
MSLLGLPTELRLRIYEFLPELAPDRYETVTAYSKITPSICRVSRILRYETVPVFASGSQFAVQIDDAGDGWYDRLSCWLDALGPEAISRIRSLQISRHWCIPKPLRWQGHVGFYMRIEQRKPKKISSKSSVGSSSTSSFRPEWDERFVRPMAEGRWDVTTGTYPVARDMRGMRLESVELLAEVIRHHLHVPTPPSDALSLSHNIDNPGLHRRDVEFLFKALEIVASHPITAYDIEQAESGRHRRLETWTNMENQLRALNAQMPAGNSLDESAFTSRFFTPY